MELVGDLGCEVDCDCRCTTSSGRAGDGDNVPVKLATAELQPDVVERGMKVVAIQRQRHNLRRSRAIHLEEVLIRDIARNQSQDRPTNQEAAQPTDTGDIAL